MRDNKKQLTAVMVFIIMFGTVSLFSDMTHEAASSIRGAFFSLLGASAAMIIVSVGVQLIAVPLYVASAKK